jgi:phage major head subunit gpT-like protein
LQRCSKVGEWAGVNKEKRVMDLVTGQTNSFKRNGTAYNTYAASGGHGIVNQITNALLDWTDMEAAYDAFDDMTDWTTGEPIIIRPTTLLVPWKLVPKAYMILNATEIRGGISNATTWQTVAPNVMNAFPGKGQVQLLSNRFVYARTSSDTKWFIGDPKRAFKWMQNWDMTPEQQTTQSDAAFTRDIVQQYKISYRGEIAVIDPHYMVYSTGAG